MMKKKTIAIIGASLLAAASGAQTFSGSLDTGARAWFDSTKIPGFEDRFEGSIKGDIGDPTAGQYYVGLRAAYDPASGSGELGLEELWVKAYLGPLELSTGRQIAAWGSTDVFNPVDVVNPVDYSFPPDQAPIPAAMVRGRLALGPLGLDLVALPWWEPSILPEDPWRKAPSLPFSPPPGVTPLVTEETNAPGASWTKAQFGGRLTGSLELEQGLDLSLSYFHGYLTSPLPSYAAGTPSGGVLPVTITLNYYRFDQLGLDFAFALDNGLLLKGEAAYKALDGTDFLEPAPSLASAEGVGGFEYSIFGVKSSAEFVLDWDRGGVGAEDLWAKTLLLALTDAPSARLELKAAAAYNLDGSGMGSVQAEYSLADGLRAGLRIFGFYGDPGTAYGDWSDNALGEVTLSYAF